MKDFKLIFSQPFLYSHSSKPIEIDDDDLEDGEIEDDDDEVIVIPDKPAELPKKEEKLSSPNSSPRKDREKDKDKDKGRNRDRKDKDKSKKSRESDKDTKRAKERRNFVEDDFASSIESQLASVLKKDGVEPPMPSVKKTAEESVVIDSDDQSERQKKSSRKRKKKSHKNNEVRILEDSFWKFLFKLI